MFCDSSNSAHECDVIGSLRASKERPRSTKKPTSTSLFLFGQYILMTATTGDTLKGKEKAQQPRREFEYQRSGNATISFYANNGKRHVLLLDLGRRCNSFIVVLLSRKTKELLCYSAATFVILADKDTKSSLLARIVADTTS